MWSFVYVFLSLQKIKVMKTTNILRLIPIAVILLGFSSCSNENNDRLELNDVDQLMSVLPIETDSFLIKEKSIEFLHNQFSA